VPHTSGTKLYSKHVATLILVLAIVLRVWDLTGRSLWLDEAVEYWTATSPMLLLPSFVRDTIQDPPLYSFLLHLWMQPSNHEAWMRLLSVWFGVGSVAGVMVVAFRLAGRGPALGAGLLMAVMPTSVHYSQEIGQYAPMQCFIVWSMAALIDLVRSPDRREFAFWGVLAACGLYTYYGTVLSIVVPFACVLVEGVMKREVVRSRRALVTMGAVAAAVLPLLIYFIPSQLHRGPTERAFEPGAAASLTQGTGYIVTVLKATLAFWFTGWPSTAISAWVTIVLAVVLIAMAAHRERRVALWVGVTTLAYMLISWLHLFPIGFRHSLILVPLFVPLMASPLRSGGSRLRRMSAMIAFVALCVCAVLSPENRALRTALFGAVNNQWPETEDIGPVTKYWAEHRSTGQPTYVYYAAAPAFAYYAERYAQVRVTRPPNWFLTCWRNEDAAWCRQGDVFYGRWLRALKPEEKAESVFETMNQVPDEFWFVIAHAHEDEGRTLARMMRQHFDFVSHYDGDNSGTALLKRRP